METIGKTSSFHTFHDFWNYGLEAPRIFEEALYITKTVEKVGLANFFYHFYDSKDFLKNSWKWWKNLAWPTFSTTQAVLEAQIVENVGQANFFCHFRDLQNFLRNCWKVCRVSFFKSH